jgi:hypothetical protein
MDNDSLFNELFKSYGKTYKDDFIDIFGDNNSIEYGPIFYGDSIEYGDYLSEYLNWGTPKKTKDGMYKLNVDLRDLIDDWMNTTEFKLHHLSVADVLLIKTYLKDGKYDEEGKEFLNTIRDRWVTYIKKQNK